MLESFATCEEIPMTSYPTDTATITQTSERAYIDYRTDHAALTAACVQKGK